MGWDIVAGSAAGGLGSGLGLIGSKKRQKRSFDLQSKLNEQTAELNYKYGEMAAENAWARQQEADATQYQTAVADAKAAGLSPGIFSGGTGAGGGGSAPQGGGSRGIQPADVAAIQSVENEKRSLAIEGSRAAAEAAVNYAEAQRIKADTGRIEGGEQRESELHETNRKILEETVERLKKENKLTDTNVSKATEEIEAIKVKRAGEELDNKLKEVTEDFRIDEIKGSVMLLMEELEEAKQKNRISAKQEEDIVEALRAQIALTKIQTIATKEGIELTEARVSQIYNDIGIKKDVHTFGDGNIYNWKSWTGFSRYLDENIREHITEPIKKGIKKIRGK